LYDYIYNKTQYSFFDFKKHSKGIRTTTKMVVKYARVWLFQ